MTPGGGLGNGIIPGSITPGGIVPGGTTPGAPSGIKPGGTGPGMLTPAGARIIGGLVGNIIGGEFNPLDTGCSVFFGLVCIDHFTQALVDHTKSLLCASRDSPVWRSGLT